MNNSRMGRVLPDVAPVDVPLVRAMLDATDAFGAGAMDVEAFQAQILALLRSDPPAVALADWVARALAEQRDQVLARRDFGDRDDTIQVIYVAPGEVHPCHCHHNVTSTQVLLTGALRAREFDRVGTLEPGVLQMRLLFDGMLAPGDVMQARDLYRNAHWFAAGDSAATLLNFNIRGYERATFWPFETRPLGRRLLDVTGPVVEGPVAGGPGAGGLLPGRIVPVEEGYARFGGVPLDAFPMPVAAAEAAPLTL